MPAPSAIPALAIIILAAVANSAVAFWCVPYLAALPLLAALAFLISSFGSTNDIFVEEPPPTPPEPSKRNADRGDENVDDDDYPDLYDEMSNMWRAASQAYLLSAACKVLRDAGRDVEKVREGPIPARRLVEMAEENGGILSGLLEDESHKMGLDSLREIAERAEESGDPGNITLREFSMSGEERRVVYMIAKNSVDRRITVFFRGSVVGTMDWTRNFQFDNAKMTVPPSVRERLRSKPRRMRMHRGYYEYLFKNDEKHEAYRMERYDEALRDVLDLLKEFPGYRLYITGHSLGAAIATMFAFRVAATTELGVPKPVNLVTFASPYVGDQTFREAFQALERAGWIRHLRVSNERDFVVCLFPFTKRADNMYKHVGVNLKLCINPGKVELSYPRVGGNFLARFFGEVRRGWNNSLLKNWQGDEERSFHHGCAEYTRRIKSHEDAIRSGVPKKLNSIYRDRKVVGDLGSRL